VSPVDAKAARLHAYLSSRALQIDYLLARAHGRVAVWYADPARLMLPEANRRAIDETHELSVSVLRARADLVATWRTSLDPDCPELTVDGMVECHAYHGQFTGPRFSTVEAAKFDEANRALGAWDGPETIIQDMKGPANVA
jgi:hypothetical protein